MSEPTTDDEWRKLIDAKEKEIREVANEWSQINELLQSKARYLANRREHLADAEKRYAEWQLQTKIVRQSVPVERICIMCRHWYFHEASEGYSEYTPGSDASMGCRKKHWSLDWYEDTQDDYRRKIMTAVTCEDFDPVEVKE